jgi:hypothetical protein
MTALPLLLLAGCAAVFGVVLSARWLDGWSWRRSLHAYRLSLPRDLTVGDVAEWLALVNAATHGHPLALLPAPPLAVEIVATAHGISHFVLVPEGSRGVLLAHLRAALPGVRLEEVPNYFGTRVRLTMAAEATLTSHQRPLRDELASTASTALLASLQPLHGTEQIVIQWLITGGGIPRIVSAVSSNQQAGGSWWIDGNVSVDSEAVRAERAKQRAPLLRAVVRVGVFSPDRRPRAFVLFGRVWGVLRTLNGPGAGVIRRWWLTVAMVRSRIARCALPITTWPLTVNTLELAGLLGLATGASHLPGLAMTTSRQLPPSPSLPSRGTVLGISNYPGLTDRRLALSTRDRLTHTWIAGPTGTGKSTLLANLIIQDMQAGSGLVVIDARGDLVPDILDRVPENRRDDLIVVDPSATTRPVGFNVLATAANEQDRERAVDHVLHIFQDLYRSSWGPRTADVLRAGLLTLVSTKALDGSAFTLCELPELLTNRPFRRFVVDQPGVQGALLAFWQWYDGLSEAARAEVIGPVLNKLRAFVLKTPLRLLLGQSQGLDLTDVFNQRRIVLVPLSKGTLGSETAQLVGSLLVASVWQATLGRVRVAPAQRRPVWLYADEFQETVRLPIDLADMLAQARGLGLGLILAHQHLGQLPETVKTAVLGTARTQILFQLDYDDARSLEKRFAPLTAQDLMGLGLYEIAVRPCLGGRTASPVTGVTLPLTEPITDGPALASDARHRYGVDRAEVEAASIARLRTKTGQGGYGRTRLEAQP